MTTTTATTAGTAAPTMASTYLPLVAAARARLMEDRRLGALLDPTLAADRLHWFLMQFSAWGVHMTKPVEGWIRRAGERCVALGYLELGRALIGHAKQEAGHEELFVEDLAYLVTTWNADHPTPVTAAQFRDNPPPAAVQRYLAVHEQGIAGPAPYVQIAIEYEVERMTPVLGPPLVAQCRAVLGPDIVKGLSFVAEHVEIDVGHTAFNERQLARFIAAHPDAALAMGQAGAIALEAYVDFLGDCLDAASVADDGP
jgi:hypothetical protein